MSVEIFVEFQEALYNNHDVDETRVKDCPTFIVDSVLYAVKIRPLSIDRICELCLRFSKDYLFSRKLLKKGIMECVPMIYRLYKLGLFQITEIVEHLKKFKRAFPCLYFSTSYDMFNDINVHSFIDSYLFYEYYENSCLEEFLLYGYSIGSLEYSIKYDDDKTLSNLLNDPCFDKKKGFDISNFEWTIMTDCPSLISASAFFGSINCFKLLLLNGFDIDEQTKVNCFASGNTDLIHMLGPLSADILQTTLVISQKYCHSSLYEWLIESSGLKRNSYCNYYNLYDIILQAEKGDIQSIVVPGQLHPICFFFEQDNFLVVDYLIKKKVSFPENQSNCLALISAIQNNKLEYIDVLCNLGANINSIDKDSKFY